MRLVMPRLYVILDAGMLREPAGHLAQKMIDAGVRLLQYRNKAAASRELWSESRPIAAVMRRAGGKFIVNDRPDVAYLAGADGVHVGQEDLDVEHSRAIVGEEGLVGVSTHNREQFEKAAASSADYIAVGPVFPTNSKANTDPVLGLSFLREVRPLTDKPIVAVGGITLELAPQAIAAGADSVAVISDILRAKDPVARAAEFITLLQTVKSAGQH